MIRFQIADPAEADIDGIADYIRQDNPVRAETFIEELYEKILQVADRPLSFPARDDISRGIRSALHGKYLILFKIDAEMIVIMRVAHGARDLKTLV